MTDSREEYKAFMKAYNNAHQLCPKCGIRYNYTMTMLGYALDMSHKEEYKDLNICKCSCGSKHTYHERLPLT